MVVAGKPDERGQLEDLSLDGSIISKLLFKKCNGGHGLDECYSG
jgi:hypothetical protein